MTCTLIVMPFFSVVSYKLNFHLFNLPSVPSFVTAGFVFIHLIYLVSSILVAGIDQVIVLKFEGSQSF